MKIVHKEEPSIHRRISYPDLGDQLDAIYKGFVALEEQGIVLPRETQNWIRKVAAVKSTFPKETQDSS